MPHEIVFREQYGVDGRELVYIKPPDQNALVQLDASFPQDVTHSLFYKVKGFLCAVFLPQGYPESVSKDYIPYQCWDTVQAFASTMNGTLTTQAIMRGVGVGNEAATPLAAAITWILKDGTGNVGRILFAWWKGTSLDADCKKWRLCADILNDFAMFLELLLPYFMSCSTVLLCTSTILKSVVGVAGGATRAALTQHQAMRENMADVSAKDGSQETCVNLLASVFGLLLLMTVEEGRFVWPLFILFTSIHLYANYRAVRSLTMSTLNKARLNLIIEEYLVSGTVPSPEEINKEEAVILGMGLADRGLCGYEIKLGVSLEAVITGNLVTADQLKLLINLNRGRSYLLLLSPQYKTVSVSLDHRSDDIIEAYFHAVLLAIASCIVAGNGSLAMLNRPRKSDQVVLSHLEESVFQMGPKSQGKQKQTLQKMPFEAVMASNEVTAVESKRFLAELVKSGWSLGSNHLQSDEWRANWSNQTRPDI